ncbi:hypothetical protein QR680_003541 [Steinernema hermaphroditum]|uniref:Uncharacterized protein n=1 Tax=Steinernema hermaphroditum TaxID=289476 RepID=A0AA39HKS0_9BILA|nr:hypothetical protein QR680_003541 [Steinernema hermaphroditum]
MVRRNASVLLLVAIAIVLAFSDGAPTRLKRQNGSSPDSSQENQTRSGSNQVPLNSDPKSLFHQTAVEINVPMKPHIYTLNVDGFSSFLTKQIEAAIVDRQKTEDDASKQEKSNEDPNKQGGQDPNESNGKGGQDPNEHKEEDQTDGPNEETAPKEHDDKNGSNEQDASSPSGEEPKDGAEGSSQPPAQQ